MSEKMLNFALPSIPKGDKHATFISPSYASPFLIRTESFSLTSREYRTKTVCKYFICGTSNEVLK